MQDVVILGAVERLLYRARVDAEYTDLREVGQAGVFVAKAASPGVLR